MNISFYAGKIGRVKFSQAQNGSPYVGFSIEETKNESENGHKNFLWVNCFQTNVIKYLKALNFKVGNYVVVEAATEYHPEEVKGKTYYRMAINAKKVWIVKTMKDVEQQK